MFLMICIFLFFYFLIKLLTDDNNADEILCEYETEERRHIERLEAIDRQTEQIQEMIERGRDNSRNYSPRKASARRRFIQQGDLILGEEIMEEYFE